MPSDYSVEHKPGVASRLEALIITRLFHSTVSLNMAEATHLAAYNKRSWWAAREQILA